MNILVAKICLYSPQTLFRSGSSKTHLSMLQTISNTGCWTQPSTAFKDSRPLAIIRFLFCFLSAVFDHMWYKKLAIPNFLSTLNKSYHIRCLLLVQNWMPLKAHYVKLLLAYARLAKPVNCIRIHQRQHSG